MKIRQEEIRNKEYRHGLVAAQIEIDLPFQLRALRKQRGWTQPQLAEHTGMKQSRFPLMEKPGGANFTLETLRRLAEAFDVALVVRFAPFSELLAWSDNFNPDRFSVPSFEEELDVGCEFDQVASSNSRMDAMRGDRKPGLPTSIDTSPRYDRNTICGNRVTGAQSMRKPSGMESQGSAAWAK